MSLPTPSQMLPPSPNELLAVARHAAAQSELHRRAGRLPQAQSCARMAERIRALAERAQALEAQRRKGRLLFPEDRTQS